LQIFAACTHVGDALIKASLLEQKHPSIKNSWLTYLNWFNNKTIDVEYNNLSIMGQKQLLKVPILADSQIKPCNTIPFVINSITQSDTNFLQMKNRNLHSDRYHNKNIHPLKIADWPILTDSTIKPSGLGLAKAIAQSTNLSRFINKTIQHIPTFYKQKTEICVVTNITTKTSVKNCWLTYFNGFNNKTNNGSTNLL
jgi:hypothetical protein